MNENKKLDIGPTLPPGIKLPSAESDDTSEEDEESEALSGQPDDLYGPALPPNFKLPNIENVIGPALPPGFQPPYSDQESDEDDDLVIGPLPNTGEDVSAERTKLEFEKRAEKMKKRLTGVEEKQEPQRDEWMTSLPTVLGKSFGLGPRTFNRRNPIPAGDRSVWTDTPADREKREKGEISQQKVVAAVPVPSVRDVELADKVEEFNKAKRTESLMEIHQKKLKRKMAEDAAKTKERRPFDRDVDLQANRFDNAQKDAIIKRSRQLNNKFSAGQASKFL